MIHVSVKPEGGWQEGPTNGSVPETILCLDSFKLETDKNRWIFDIQLILFTRLDRFVEALWFFFFFKEDAFRIKRLGQVFFRASKHVYKRLCPLFGRSVGRSLTPSLTINTSHVLASLSSFMKITRRKRIEKELKKPKEEQIVLLFLVPKWPMSNSNWMATNYAKK